MVDIEQLVFIDSLRGSTPRVDWSQPSSGRSSSSLLDCKQRSHANMRAEIFDVKNAAHEIRGGLR